MRQGRAPICSTISAPGTRWAQAPARQVAAQCGGVVMGSLAGSFVYLTLISDPANQLITPEWPALLSPHGRLWPRR
ncbi:MAG: hypothetical protein R3D01_13270 [Hyphomicrobiales bacterium]